MKTVKLFSVPRRHVGPVNLFDLRPKAETRWHGRAICEGRVLEGVGYTSSSLNWSKSDMGEDYIRAAIRQQVGEHETVWVEHPLQDPEICPYLMDPSLNKKLNLPEGPQKTAIGQLPTTEQMQRMCIVDIADLVAQLSSMGAQIPGDIAMDVNRFLSVAAVLLAKYIQSTQTIVAEISTLLRTNATEGKKSPKHGDCVRVLDTPNGPQTLALCVVAGDLFTFLSNGHLPININQLKWVERDGWWLLKNRSKTYEEFVGDS